MVRGKPIKLRITLTSSSTGLPVGADLVSDIQLSLYSTADRVAVKTIAIGSGVTKESDGVFLLEVDSADTLNLPKTGTAYLEGWAEPVHESVKINLGLMKDNIKNG